MLSPTPNYFYRAYSLGRTHTGMLAYLCDLNNAGKKQPLRFVLDELGLDQLKLPDKIRIQFEFKQADLGLFDGNHCFLLIEMKVDDRELGKQAKRDDVLDVSKGWYKGLREIQRGDSYSQTVLYQHRAHQSNRWVQHNFNYPGELKGQSPEVLLVTLGVGEYGLLKVDPNAQKPALHIGLKQWTSAFAKTSSLKDGICSQYLAALEQETVAREQIIARFGQRDADEKEIQVRSSLHPILWRMAHVMEGVKAPSNWPVKQAFHTIVKTARGGDPMVEMPTTEDSYEDMPAPLYMELKQSGYLHLKMYGKGLDISKQQLHCTQTVTSLEKLSGKYGDSMLIVKGKKNFTKASDTRTIFKFSVGLEKGIHLKQDVNLEEVQARITSSMNLYVEILNDLQR